MNNNNVVSIDLAKSVFQVCVLSEHNKVLMNKKVSRVRLLETVMQANANRVVMEACYSSNFWGRLFQKHGLEVNLIPPHQVKPFVVGNKNDRNDAVAIAEASRRPRATFVQVKTLEQQDVQSLDRIRQRLIKSRTALANQIRGLLAECGIIFKTGISTLRSELPYVIEDADNDLTWVAREFIADLQHELFELDQRIKKVEVTATELLSQNAHYHLLLSIPGVGPAIARAMICSVNDARQFKNGRQMAAWVGVTPKQHASGEQSRMSGISKRGNQNLRRQLIHGARAVVSNCQSKDDPLSRWVQNLLLTKGKNTVCVALANKLTRIAWAVLKTGECYQSALLLGKAV